MFPKAIPSGELESQEEISMAADIENAATREDRAWSKTPKRKTFSPYDVGHSSKSNLKYGPCKRIACGHPAGDTALIPNSSAMDGRATLTEEPMNGMRNEAKVVTSKTDLFSAPSTDFMERIIMDREEII